MLRVVPGSMVLLLCVGAHAGAPYVSVGIGYGDEEVTGSTAGVNHPTRCDRLLYANPEDAPSDAACTDATSRDLFEGSFDLDGAFVGSGAVGYAWERLRVEAEFLGRGHSGGPLPAFAGDNPALVGKQSEWSEQSPPQYRISDFKVRQLFVNVYYTFANASSWTPYVGAGIGFARVAADYSGSYLRRTVADGYVAAAGGDPARPAEWQLAAAGSLSLLDVEVEDEVFGYQLLAGIERGLSERASLFATVRWSDFEEVTSDDVWTTIRSHAPVQADGATPFTTRQTLEEIGGFVVTGGVRYTF